MIGTGIGARGRLALLALPLAACAGAGDRLEAQPAAAHQASRAERVALALAGADEAQRDGKREDLTRAVRLIDQLGARPMAEAPDDPVPAWRTMALADEPPLRGRPLGPGYRQGTIAPGTSERIEQLFLSGQRAHIAVSTPGSRKLELKVADAAERPVCDGREAAMRCQWVPLFTQRYTIEIANPGNQPTRYYLVVE